VRTKNGPLCCVFFVCHIRAALFLCLFTLALWYSKKTNQSSKQASKQSSSQTIYLSIHFTRSYPPFEHSITPTPLAHTSSEPTLEENMSSVTFNKKEMKLLAAVLESNEKHIHVSNPSIIPQISRTSPPEEQKRSTHKTNQASLASPYRSQTQSSPSTPASRTQQRHTTTGPNSATKSTPWPPTAARATSNPLRRARRIWISDL